MNIVITGGAGFIGCNIADALKDRAKVTVIDNLSRRGTEANLEWLRSRNPSLNFVYADLRSYNDLCKPDAVKAFAEADAVYHLAGQVAVTTSVTDPREDFEVNALGTFNLIQAVRMFGRDGGRHPVVIYASTNKVYGGMEDVLIELKERNGGKRYEYADMPQGASESINIDFHSPYGCTKGYADQYVRDVARPDIYDMKTVVFRQSCIYGPRQFGIEDQGWVAWFTIAAATGINASIYGDGMQTRDVLHVDDLVRAYEMATQQADKVKGQIFNIGGGPENTMSLLELIQYLEKFSGKKLTYRFADWRPGDQRSFVCDIRKAKNGFGWAPQIGVHAGIRSLYDWIQGMLRDNPSVFDFLRKK